MQAVWMNNSTEDMNITLAFILDLEESPAYTLRLQAANNFRVLADNTLIGYGPMRSAHGYSLMHTYAIPQSAKRVVVEVAGYNIQSYYTVKEQPFFKAEVTADGVAAYTSTNFIAYRLDDRLQKVQRYSYQRNFVESYVVEHDRSVLFSDTIPFPAVETVPVPGNASLESDLSYQSFRADAIETVIEKGSVERRPGAYAWKDRSTLDVGSHVQVGGFKIPELCEVLSEEVCSLHYDRYDTINNDLLQESYNLYDLGSEKTGFFALDVEVLSDAVIYITFDEIIWEECRDQTILQVFHDGAQPMVFHRMDTVNVVKYQIAAGRYRLLSFEPVSFRYVKLMALDGKVRVHDFKVVRYENDDVYRCRLTSDDHQLQSIFEASAATLSQNAVDVLTDCPSRERAGWLCDSYFSAKVELLLSGWNKVEENLLRAYYLSPQSPHLPEGMVPMCYPADHFDGVYIPTWAMWYILELEDQYYRSGNRAVVEASREKVLGIINFFLDNHLNEDGLLEKLESWVMIEWSKANDYIDGVNYPANMLFTRALLAAANLYDRTDFGEIAGRNIKTIIAQSFNGQFFEDNRVRNEQGELVRTGNISETCQYYAFYFGIIDKRDFLDLYTTMFTEFGPNRDDTKIYPEVCRANSLAGNYMRLDFLMHEGRVAQVIDECRDYFLYMVERTGTLWEHDKPHASCNHAFASMPAVWIVNALSGYLRTDFIEKKIYFNEPALDSNTTIDIPIADEIIQVEISGRDRKIRLPDGYVLMTV
jgi:alpha-L-rhamnosidase